MGVLSDDLDGQLDVLSLRAGRSELPSAERSAFEGRGSWASATICAGASAGNDARAGKTGTQISCGSDHPE